MNTIDLESVKKLEKRCGAWVWDGVIYNRDSITNPKLAILPNAAGARLLGILSEIAVRKPDRRKVLYTFTES